MAALRSAILNVMTGAAQKAARSLVHDFGEVEQLQVSRKGPADFVSTADTNAEAIIKAELSKARPDYGFLMEESGGSTGRQADRRWIVDPLDGTTNFLHGLPHWCISIALEAEGEIVAGVIYDPVKDEMFMAETGQGAFVNNRRMRVSTRSTLPDCLIATGVPIGARYDSEETLAQLRAMLDANIAVRRFGSAALDLAYVAAGRYDGYWEYTLKPWDVAAGVLMVREAGGYVGEVNGGANPVYNPSILASNTQINVALAELLAPALPSATLRQSGTKDIS
jgi:myo-inositol-1(or 4)-monophosphatase